MIARLALVVLLSLAALPAPACERPAGLDVLRAELLAETNAARAGQGRGALLRSPALEAAAQAQACRMAERGEMTHRGSWLAGLGRRLRREGYAYAMAVENIGDGHASAAQVVAHWMRSPGHRENMLARAAREAGFGVARTEDGRLMWSMIAAAPRAGA